MRRREFISLIGGAAALPLVARAQQAGLPLVGFLRSTSSSGSAHLVAAMRRGLSEIGWAEGQNIAIIERYADGDRALLRDHVAELMQRKVSVIVANTIGAITAKSITATVPIVFVTGSDPVGHGLITSLNRPGGNVTGVIFPTGELTGKRLSLLLELISEPGPIGALFDSNAPGRASELKEVEHARPVLGRQIEVVAVKAAHELGDGFATLAKAPIRALLVGGGPMFLGQRAQLVALAAQHRLPAAYVSRQYVDAGGLMSYGPSQTDSYRQAGIYAGRILKGERPGNLPVMLPTKFDLIINLKTAKALGLAVPNSIQLLADEIIE